MSAAITYKLRRIRAGAAPRLLDLFSGCGGLTLGFVTAGFRPIGAVDNDPIAIGSYARNFHDSANRARHAVARDICELSPARLVREIGLRSVEKSIDVIVGGPPCQAFARVGRAKLREIAAHPKAFRQDKRGNLYLRYIQFVREMQPLALLMENVPDALNYGGHNIAQETAEVLSDLGYVCRYTLLNAAYYGVPQMRERMFLLAFHEDVSKEVFFPEPTHWLQLPRGYDGTRLVALRTMRNIESLDTFVYADPPSATCDLPPAITAEGALADLPTITAHLAGKMKRGMRRFDTEMPYPANASLTQYASLMREWPGFESNGGIKDHVIRSLPRDYAIFRRMKPGDQYPQAHKLATKMFAEQLGRLRRNGHAVSSRSGEYKKLMRSMIPPYDPGKFPNKWRKMERDEPSRTLMAHLGKDSYSHIHYDSDQARTISVREAARLQSFPDGFIFEGAMNSAFRQIGNAVPPLLANAIAHAMLDGLGVEDVAQSMGNRLAGLREKSIA